MSCNPIDPCFKPCPEPYDNCGCINPTTLDCVTDKNSGLKASDIIADIKVSISDLNQNEGKVLIDGDDNCLGFLEDKIAEGSNINFSYEGEGCTRKLVINATEGGVPVNVNVKVSANDTTSGYLNSKISNGVFIKKTLLNAGSNESLRLDITPADLISGDTGNLLTVGSDNRLKTSLSAPDGTETKIIEGTGVTVTGVGSNLDPYIISINPSIEVSRPCFDNTWRSTPTSLPGNANISYLSGTPFYRYRHDGTIELKGNISYTVNFGNYYGGTRQFSIPLGVLPINCITSTEILGTSELKNLTYIDGPAAGVDQITQTYGYIIRRVNQNLFIDFQSAFISATSKTIVVNLDGSVIYPNL